MSTNNDHVISPAVLTIVEWVRGDADQPSDTELAYWRNGESTHDERKELGSIVRTHASMLVGYIAADIELREKEIAKAKRIVFCENLLHEALIAALNKSKAA